MPDPAVRVEVRPDAVAVLTFDQPGGRANILSAALWSEFEAAIDSLAGRTGLQGLVLASAKPGIFIAGADLKLFLNLPGPNDPTCLALIEHGLRVLAKLEALPVPTCAAIDGAALGGGLEVALACDYRVCGTNPKVELGLPEVKLGLIPGWGGTQRLPRVAGIKTACHAITAGRSYTGPEAVSAAIADECVDSVGLLDAAARRTLGPPDWPARRGRKPEPFPAKSCVGFASTVPADPPALHEAMRCIVSGAPLPLTEGLKLETEAFQRLAGSDESKRLIGEFFAARKKA